MQEAPNSYLATGARRRKYDDVSNNLQMTQSFTSNQGQIWKAVQSHLCKSQTHSETQNCSDYIRGREQKIEIHLQQPHHSPRSLSRSGLLNLSSDASFHTHQSLFYQFLNAPFQIFITFTKMM